MCSFANLDPNLDLYLDPNFGLMFMNKNVFLKFNAIWSCFFNFSLFLFSFFFFLLKCPVTGLFIYKKSGFRGGSGACRPVGTFWYFSKNDSKSGTVHFFVNASFQTPAAWPPMNRRTCVPARHRQHLHVPYQICYHFLKSTKKYRRGDARQKPPEIPGSYTPPAVHY